MEDTSDTSVTSSCFCFLDDSDEKSPAQRLSACSLPSWQEEDGEEEKSSNEGDAGNEDDDEQEQQVEENESQFLTGQGGEIYNEDLVIDDELEFLANRFDNNPIDDRDHEKNLVEPTMIDESNRWGSDDSMGPPQPPKPMPALIPVMRSNTPTTYVNRRSDNLLDDVQSFSSHNSEESLDNDDLLLGLSPEEKEEAKADSRPSSRADSYSTWSTCYDQQEFSSSHTLSSGDSSSSSCQRIPKNLVFTPPDHPNQKARRSPFQADLEFEKQGSNSSLFYPLPFFVQDRRKFLLEKRMNSLRKCIGTFSLSIFRLTHMFLSRPRQIIP